jgi:hypothetical protein
VGEFLYQFLQAFYKANEKYQDRPFFIFGESYGGEGGREGVLAVGRDSFSRLTAVPPSHPLPPF